jgi:hypothetical protein
VHLIHAPPAARIAPSCRTASFKATGQATPASRSNFTFFRGNKEKFGRGASATVRPNDLRPGGPTPLYKGEANFVLGNNLFLSAKGAHRRAASA